MSTKPILFNTDMVRAILEGRKTVTRRVVLPQPKGEVYQMPQGSAWPNYWGQTGSDAVFAPKYHPGDILYVREAYRLVDFDHADGDWSATVQYKADDGWGRRLHRLKDGTDEKFNWRPSIHMPKEAARIFLLVTGVRAERLQEIECIAKEGITLIPADNKRDPRFYFIDLWDSTIKPTDRDKYGWVANPWVWVIEFERISREEAVL